jgi:hypothetical protein
VKSVHRINTLLSVEEAQRRDRARVCIAYARSAEGENILSAIL